MPAETETEKTRIANQRLIDEAYLHLHKTGKPSYDKLGRSCMYVGSGCAFAPAIAKYNTALEGSSARDLLTYYSDHLHEWARPLDPSLADAVQLCHDRNADTPETFLAAFDSELKQLCDTKGYVFPGDKQPSTETEPASRSRSKRKGRIASRSSSQEISIPLSSTAAGTALYPQRTQMGSA